MEELIIDVSKSIEQLPLSICTIAKINSTETSLVVIVGYAPSSSPSFPHSLLNGI